MKTATETRIEQQKAAMRRDELANHPEAQAEVIANHYTKMLATAQHLHGLLRMRLHGHGNENLDYRIEHLTEEIKARYLADFGLALDWSQPINPDTAR